MRACKCPNCGSNLAFDDNGREYIFCQFCGTKIDLMDQRTVHTEHIVDDAKIKNAESIHRIVNIFASPFEDYRKKKQDKAEQEAREAEEAAEAARVQAERNREQAEAFKAASITAFAWCIRFVKHHKEESVAGLIAVVLLISLASGASRSDARKKAVQAELAASSHMAMGELKFPDDASFSGDYRNIYKALKDAGFTNITLAPAEDLIFGFLETENDIIEVTVDGAPSFDEDAWYPADVPIVISYHSFIGSASEKIENAKTAASVSQSTSSAVSSDSSSAKETGIIVHSLNELPGTSKSTVRSFSYQFAFAHSGNANSMHYWLIDPTNLVVCLLNTYEQSAYLFTLPSVRFTTGVTLDYGAASYTLQTAQLNSVLSVTYGSDGPYDFSAVSVQDALSVISMDIHGCYDLRSVTSLEVPFSDDAPSAISDTSVSPASLPASSAASNSSNSTSTYSEPEPSLNYTPSHSETNYDVAYGQRFSEYTNYCLISYQDKIVRFFSYGNGSKEAYVGHITGGSKSNGLTVHYNYDNGWDETIKIVGSQMILTDANGYHYAFDLSPLSPVRDIYKDNHYHDITEN